MRQRAHPELPGELAGQRDLVFRVNAAWPQNLTDAAERTGALPRLSALARSLHGELSRR